MSYQAVFALYLIAVILFTGPLLLTAASLPGVRRPGREVDRLRAMNLWVATPALLGVWAAGGTMAIEAGWLAMGWLKVKLLLVLLLSGLHGRQLRALRRLRGGQAVRSGYGALGIAAAAIAAIAMLAATKPF